MKYRTFTILMLLALLLVSVVPIAAQDTECEDGFRLLDHELLATDPVCIPENPERIVTIDEGSYSAALSLGIVPVAAGDDAIFIVNEGTPYLEPDVESIGLDDAINLERLLEIEPDIIFLPSYQTSELIDNSKLIAPTVVYDYASGDFKETVVMVAEAVNAEDQLAELEVGYEERITTFKEMTDLPDDFRVAVVRPNGDGRYRLAVNSLFQNTILNDAGVSLPDEWSSLAERFYAYISNERLDLVEADIVLLWALLDIEEEEVAYSTLLEDPLWQSLSVVQSGEVYFVGRYWAGEGYPEAHLVIDDLFTYVAGVDPQEVSPNPFLTDDEVDMEATEEPSN